MTILFQLVIKIFQFFGMWPMKVSGNKTTVMTCCNAFLIFWSLVNIVSVSVYIILICVYYQLVLDKLKGVGSFSAVSKGGIVLITHLIILLESLYTRRDQESLWMKAKSVDRIFDEMGVATDVHNDKFYKNYCMKFFAYQVFAWSLEIIVLILVHQDNLSWTIFNCATLFSVMVSRTRHLHHAVYLDMLTADFCAIKNQLEMLVYTTKSTHEFTTMNRKNTINSLDKIKLAKTAYSLLYEMSVELNDIVSLSQLVNLTQGFIYLTSDLHSLYVKLYLNDFAALSVICLSLLPTFAGLVLVMHSCEKCLGEVRLIGYLLHNIEKDDKQQQQHQFDLIIENFSLQILHEPLSFSVAGFFNLDFMLLKAMVAAITTYMVIFIQFMPKDESVSTNVTELIANSTK